MKQRGERSWLAAFIFTWLTLIFSSLAQAGDLDQAEIARRFPPPFKVAAKLTEVPAWPLSSELTPNSGPVAYVFESIDLAPIPGFEGTPFNLLIAIDAQGNFISVEVLRQHEPVFLSGLGMGPLNDFVAQYTGKNIKQRITISNVYGERNRVNTDSGRVVLDGVTKATASIHIVNQTVLASALAVARVQLGLSTPGERIPAEVRSDIFEKKDFAALLKDGDIVHRRWTNTEVEALFSNSEGSGLDPIALSEPGADFVDLYVAYLNAPTIGKALLGEAEYKKLIGRLSPGQSAYWIASSGRHALFDEDFVRGTVPARLTLSQDSVPLEARDADLELSRPAGAPDFTSMLILKTPDLSGLDPGRAISIGLDVVREKGQVYPTRFRHTLTLDYAPPTAYFIYPPTPLPAWLVTWGARWPELAAIGVALILLSVMLAKPRWISVNPRRMQLFRLSFLAFTLIFIGWYAQGQLSIVQLTGAVKTLAAGQGLGSFLYDPVSLLLIAFTLISFFVWGRGTFCGWLCPFGALQEFLALLAQRLRIKSKRLPASLESVLERGRYVLLFALLVAAAFAPQLAESLVEVEPFKTSITLGFDRSWPYLAWAVGLLLLSAVYYKLFCRFICPLGAAITLGGRLRRWNWLPRRQECGKPCQTCRSRCEYDAIARDGAIIYDRCFQCLDCVGVYHDEKRCAPLIFHARKGRDFPAPRAAKE